jgi:hypothetical protein
MIIGFTPQHTEGAKPATAMGALNSEASIKIIDDGVALRTKNVKQLLRTH